MYELAASLSPDSLYEIARTAYRELLAAGVLSVGEFHYVHHQPDGTPYADRTVMSDALVRAARDVGLRICLLRVIYARAGAGRPPEGVQVRFCDGSLERGLADVETLVARYASDPDVRIGVAPHSVRAVPPDWLHDIGEFAYGRALPVHMHVAEQPAEVEQCIAETGRRPVELLADRGLLGEQFVAVHATHLTLEEAAMLGRAGTFVCLCPTTERDLGDGLPDLTALRGNRVRLCMGVDGYVLTDPFEDLRGIELGERLRTGRRFTDRAAQSPAARLWKIGSEEGARALGFDDPGGTIEIHTDAPSLALVGPEHLLDAVVFSGSPSLVARISRT
jgi:formiminoglutamate deiminase